MFCNVRFLSGQAAEIFGKLEEEDYLQGLEEEDFIRRLAYYFSKINALHPFREGNGRSQREFIRCLALHNGYVLNFANASKAEMMKASEDSFLCDYRAMEQLFKIVLEEKHDPYFFLVGNLCIRGRLLDNTPIQNDYWTTKFVKGLILNDRGIKTDDRAQADFKRRAKISLQK